MTKTAFIGRLTEKRALELARERWGETAFASKGWYCVVGAEGRVRGRGWTWNDAANEAGLFSREATNG